MRLLAALLALIALAGCAGRAHHARVARHDDLSAIHALPIRLQNGHSGAPVTGLNVSGTITNTDGRLLRCNAVAFLLVEGGGNAIAPSMQWCDAPAIAPNGSGYFSVTFAATAARKLQLRFEHPDGSYEVHELAVPPA